MMIDTHLHLWEEPSKYSWLNPEDPKLAPINRAFAVTEGLAASRELGCDRAVLVQAADSEYDTWHMLKIAQAHAQIVGVVGWVPLTDTDRAAKLLEQHAAVKAPLVGVRELIHDQQDSEILDRPEVRKTLALLAEKNLVFEVPDAYPAHLPAATRVAREMPELTVVLDHLGKPPALEGEDFAVWQRCVTAFAKNENTVAKISGLHHGGVAFSDEQFLRVWNFALETFGPERLMLGSDFPMPLLADGIEQVATQIKTAFNALDVAAQADIGKNTACRVYGLL